MAVRHGPTSRLSTFDALYCVSAVDNVLSGAGSAANKNARRYDRIPYLGPVRISWEDANGHAKCARVKCLDVPESGLRIEVPGPVCVRTILSLQAERINLAGSATVKHVTRTGLKYILGIGNEPTLARPSCGNSPRAMGAAQVGVCRIVAPRLFTWPRSARDQPDRFVSNARPIEARSVRARVRPANDFFATRH